MISYAGVPLLLPTAELVEYFDQYMPLSHILPAGPNHNFYGTWRQKSSGPTPRGIPLINWPEPPKLKVNQIYWPTGASRWAVGLFLINTEQYQAIFNQARPLIQGSSESSGMLFLSNGTNATELKMWALEPRGLHSRQGFVIPEDLFILPLVDQRYWWQFRNTSWDKEFNPAIDEPPTWEEFFHAIEDDLGLTLDIPGSLDEGYGKPDPYTLCSMHDNPAVLLDVAAASVGRRVICQGDHVVLSEPPTGLFATDEVVDLSDIHPNRSSCVTGGQTNLSYHIRAGHAHVPERVDVVFRKWREGIVSPRGEEYAITKHARDYMGSEGVYRSVITIRTTALADFTDSEGGPSEPVNQAELDALAELIAHDYYARMYVWYDVSHACDFVRPSLRTRGSDDYVLCSLGSIGPDGPQALIEVHSLPPNFAITELCHCFDEQPQYWPEARWECTQEGGIGLGGSGTVKMMVADADGADGELIDSGLEVLLHDPIGIGPAEGTHQGYMRYMPDANRWEMWQRECGDGPPDI